MTVAPDQQLATDDEQEWLVGIVPLPTYVTENGRAYRPSAIVWLDAATELIVGTTVVPPEGALEAAAAHLRTAARGPRAGAPALPARIRAASPELADALRREALDGVDVVCAPTPELDRAAASLVERLAPDDEERELRYLGADATVEGTAAMFRAAARLYDAKPWDIVPSDNHLLGITSEQLGLRDAVVSVIGQAGEVHGFVLFTCIDDLQRFGDASDQAERGQPAKFPCHLAVTYARRAEAGPALLAEIAAHRWKVADPRAYPVVTAIDEDAVGRNPTRAEMLRMEAIAVALAEIMREPELEDALDGASNLTFRRKLATSGGELELEMQVPVPGQQPSVPDDTLLGDDDALDDDRVDTYRRQLLDRFEASPEAQAEPAAHWGTLVVDYAASYFGKTVMSLSPAELDELVFEVVPRKVSVDPKAAPSIIAGLRALLAFVRREHPDSRAEACLASLEANASQRLARLLADSSNFGPAKFFVMSGRAAGFDMTSQSGMDGWAAHMRRHDMRLPVGFPVPSAAPARTASPKPGPSTKAKTAKRKAQRTARKKTRSR
jgi:hypothetical protein